MIRVWHIQISKVRLNFQTELLSPQIHFIVYLLRPEESLIRAGVYRCRDWKLDWILTDLQKLKVWDSSHLGLSLLWALQIQIYLHKGLRRKVWILAGDFMLGPDDPLASRGILYFWPGSYIKIFLKSWEIDAKNIFHFFSVIGLCLRRIDWLVSDLLWVFIGTYFYRRSFLWLL